MEQLFSNRSTYTKRNIIEASRVSSSRKLATILFICLGLLIFLFGLLSREYVFCFLGVLFCTFYPLFSIWAVRFSAANRYQQLMQLYHCEVESVASFYEDHFNVHHFQDGSDVKVAYSQVAKVFEAKNLYFIMLSTRIGFMLDKQGFEGITADEFGRFIRARAVGEGQIDYKKKKRKNALIITAIFIGIFAVGVSLGFLGDVIESKIPKTFSYGNYSIRLTSAFDENDGEWTSPDVTVYCVYETAEDLRGYDSVYETAAAYLQDSNESSEISTVVTPVSDTSAWSTFTDTYNGFEYRIYNYVVMSDGDIWYTEFYCLEEDAENYLPQFSKWAQTIKINNEMS